MARKKGREAQKDALAKNADDIATAETEKQDASNFDNEGRGGSSGTGKSSRTGSPGRRTRSTDGAEPPAKFRQISTAEQKQARNSLVANRREAKRQKNGNHPDKDTDKDAEFDIGLETVEQDDSGSGSEQEQDGESYRFSTASIL